MKIFYLFYLFIHPYKKNTNDYNKKSIKNMSTIYYSEDVPNNFIMNNDNNNYNNNHDNNHDNNNDNNNNDYNNYDNNSTDNNNTYKKILYNIDGYDNRNITEKNILPEIIKYNKIMNMLDFLLSNKSSTFEKVYFIEKNDILKKNNIYNEDFNFFKDDENIF